MTTISYSEAREKLATVWDQTISTREPIIIDRRGHESVVIVPESEWRGLQETAHLLRSPKNAQRLLAALNRLDQGEGVQLSIDELAGKLGKS